MKALAHQLLVAALVSAALITAYDRLFVRPVRTIGVVDSLAVLRSEEQHLSAQLTGEMSVQQKERIAVRARTFARDFPRVLEQIAHECGCLVVDRSAVIGSPPNMIDLTPELARRMR